MSNTEINDAKMKMEDLTYRKVVWHIVPLLIVCFIFAYFDRVNISFAKLQIQNDLGFSNAVYGLGASIFFIGYFILKFPAISFCGAWVRVYGLHASWCRGGWLPQR